MNIVTLNLDIRLKKLVQMNSSPHAAKRAIEVSTDSIELLLNWKYGASTPANHKLLHRYPIFAKYTSKIGSVGQ